jgi:hypothetical protein
VRSVPACARAGSRGVGEAARVSSVAGAGSVWERGAPGAAAAAAWRRAGALLRHVRHTVAGERQKGARQGRLWRARGGRVASCACARRTARARAR